MNRFSLRRFACVLLLLTPFCVPDRVFATTPSVCGLGGPSQTSVDWAGYYWANIPCGGCSGVDTVLLIRMNGTFRIERRNIDKAVAPTVSEGVFEWLPDGNTIVCRESGGQVTKFLVRETRLFQLDAQGQAVTGDLAKRYVFYKVTDGVSRVPYATLKSTNWKLTALMGKPVVTGNGQHEVRMMFKTCSSLLQGSSGCNTFYGTYELLPYNRIRFSRLDAGQKPCQEMVTEQDVLSVLTQADSYLIKGNVLLLSRTSDKSQLARFEAVIEK